MIFFSFLQSTVIFAAPCPVFPQEGTSSVQINSSWLSTEIIPTRAHSSLQLTQPLRKAMRTTIRTDEHTTQGYQIHTSENSLQIFKIVQTQAYPITPQISFIASSHPYTIHILQNEQAMEAHVCAHDSSLVSLRWEDTAFSEGRMHIASTTPFSVSTVAHSNITPAFWPHDIAGTDVLLSIDPNRDLPPILQENMVQKAPENGVWVYLPNRSLLPRIQSYTDAILSIRTHTPYWAHAKTSEPTPEKLQNKLDELSKQYQLTQHIIGTSKQGQPIIALSNHPHPIHEKPSILIWGGTEGDDISSVQYVLQHIHTIFHPKDGLEKRWRDSIQFWFVPLLNVDGYTQFWYHSDQSGHTNVWDTNKDGIQDIWEGTFLHHNTSFSFQQTPAETRGEAPLSEPENQAIMSVIDYIHPVLAFSWSSTHNDLLHNEHPFTQELWGLLPKTQKNTEELFHHTGLHNTMFEGYGTHSFSIPIHSNNSTLWTKLFNHTLAGPAIRMIVTDESGFPISAQIESPNIPSSGWSTRTDGYWMFLVPKHNTYSITIQADGYETQQRTVQTNAIYRIHLKKKSP